MYPQFQHFLVLGLGVNLFCFVVMAQCSSVSSCSISDFVSIATIDLELSSCISKNFAFSSALFKISACFIASLKVKLSASNNVTRIVQEVRLSEAEIKVEELTVPPPPRRPRRLG